MVKKFDAPQSCRGLKTVSFPENNNNKLKFAKEKECNIIEKKKYIFSKNLIIIFFYFFANF